jgi:hypothetical protein
MRAKDLPFISHNIHYHTINKVVEKAKALLLRVFNFFQASYSCVLGISFAACLRPPAVAAPLADAAAANPKQLIDLAFLFC